MHDVPPSTTLETTPPAAGIGEIVVSADSARAAEIHRRVIEFTKGIFPGEPQIDVIRDPEFGDWAYSISVNACGDVPTLVNLSERWHSGLLDAAEELAGIYCLSLVPSNESH